MTKTCHGEQLSDPRVRPLGVRRTATSLPALLAVLAATVVAAACGEADPEPAATPSTLSPAALAQPAIVPPSLVAGLDTRVEESFGPGRVTFATLPVIPGAEAFTAEIQQAIDADIARFEADTAPADNPPYPELVVGWDLVAASPKVLGARIITTELDGVGDDGRVATTWYDAEAGTALASSALLADGSEPALVDRLRRAGAADPRIDAEALEGQLADEDFDALAFTSRGELLVEFDQGAVAAEGLGPVALAVDPEGLLSAFGEKASVAATAPSDPALAPPPPTATPRPAVTGGADVDCSVQRCVALTFDDGPVAGTADLLDVLADKGVPATFFVVGSNAQAQPDLLARMVSEGHVVGNHTQDHPDLTKLDAEQVRDQIDQVNDTVAEATGIRPTLLRPPYGATSPTVADVAAAEGMAQVLWNVDPEDWKDRDSTIVQQRVLSSTNDGDIVLSHDIHETTREAYAAIIDGLVANGYTLVTVPQLLGDLEPGQVYRGR
jgi:peptidoglycan/xylan/chitin deacetylase (PgdA/CDA1 family)